jgi:hypothetical protein
MQSLKAWLPWIAAIAGAGFLGNGGYVLNAALNMDSSNISVIAQSAFFLLLGIGGVGYAAKSKGVDTGKPAFADDMAAIEHLATNCKDCKDSQKALETLTVATTKRLFNA